MTDTPTPCSQEARTLGCTCVKLKGGSVVVSPACRVHCSMTDYEHGVEIDLRSVIPPRQASDGRCQHEPARIGGWIPTPRGFEICKHCRCLYLPLLPG